jgi:hypothetical protein
MGLGISIGENSLFVENMPFILRGVYEKPLGTKPSSFPKRALYFLTKCWARELKAAQRAKNDRHSSVKLWNLNKYSATNMADKKVGSSTAIVRLFRFFSSVTMIFDLKRSDKI